MAAAGVKIHVPAGSCLTGSGTEGVDGSILWRRLAFHSAQGSSRLPQGGKGPALPPTLGGTGSAITPDGPAGGAAHADAGG